MVVYTQDNYEGYCAFIREHGLEPVAFDTWVSWNEEIDKTEENH